MFRQIKAAMECCNEWGGLAGEQRERVIVEMEMENVEVLRPVANVLQHHNVQGIGISDRPVETQGFWPHRFQLGRRMRIAAGKQRDVMTECHKFFGQPRDYPLGTSVEFWRNCFSQRTNL